MKSHNPYVLPTSGGGQAHFAISPIDLYTNSNEQPTGALYINPQQSQGQSQAQVKRYIYAPDDIIYPWYNQGSMRTGVTSDIPASYYSATTLGNDYTSFAYIGAQGYRLAGYDIWYGASGTKHYTFLLNEETDTGLSEAFPCIDRENRSTTNKLSLDEVLNTESELEDYITGSVINLQPIFVKVSPVKLSLSYEEEKNSLYGSYTAKTSVVGNYRLNFSGIDINTVKVVGLDLTRFNLDTIDYYLSGAAFREIGSRILYDDGVWSVYSQRPGLLDTQRVRTLGSTEYTYNAEAHTFSVKLTSLYVDTYDADHTNIVDVGSTIFIRGLESRAEDGLNAGLYKPGRFMEIESGESFKYSCFINKKNSEYRLFTRVFTANDVFSDSVDANGDIVYGPIGGVIMDMAGSVAVTSLNQTILTNDCYGMAYYGGVIVPCSTSTVSPEYCVGSRNLISSSNAVGRIDSTVAAAICQHDVTRQSAGLCGTKISTFLDIGSNGTFTYAGIFEFKPYAHIKLLTVSDNYPYVYIYNAEQSDPNGNYYSRRPAPWGASQSYSWKTLLDATSGQDALDTSNVTLYMGSDIGEIPDGFIKIYWGGAEALLYTGTDSYTVSGKAVISDVDAKVYRVDIQYLN